MRNKIAAGIMLLAGSVAVIVCLLNGASLDTMLVSVFLSMFVFMIIGFAIQSVVEKMNADAQVRMQEEAERVKQEEAKAQAEREEAERLAREVELAEAQGLSEEEKKAREEEVINELLAAGESAKRTASGGF